MRKKPAFLLVLTIVLTLLTGCAAAEPAQLPLSFRTQLLQAGACSFTAEIRADYGDTVVPFTLACSWTPDGTELTVVQPESIAGIRAAVRGSAACVTFDDTQIGLGSLAEGALAPLAAPYVLAQCWAGEYIDCTGTEDGLLRTTYRMGYDEQELTVDVWFQTDPAVPVRAEISCDDVMQMQLRISDFRVG